MKLIHSLPKYLAIIGLVYGLIEGVWIHVKAYLEHPGIPGVYEILLNFAIIVFFCLFNALLGFVLGFAIKWVTILFNKIKTKEA